MRIERFLHHVKVEWYNVVSENSSDNFQRKERLGFVATNLCFYCTSIDLSIVGF